MQKRKRLALVSLIASAFSSAWSAAPPRQSPVPGWDLAKTLNQEAEASDLAGIHKYSKDLIQLITPEGVSKGHAKLLTDRLAAAELAARQRTGKMVHEADIVRAFNDLMLEVTAPDSLRTDEDTVRRMRVGQLAVSPVPALITVNRNEGMCNPGEAVYLLYLLILNNGTLASSLPEGMKASELPRMRISSRPANLGNSWHLLSKYLSRCSQTDTVRTFNNVAQTLGF
jgi:hypothetical protein